MGILGHPRKFFGELPESVGMIQAAGFLTVSAIVHCAAALIHTAPSNYLVMGGTLLANAIGMVFLLTGLGYTLVSVTSKSKVRFGRLFRIYALSSGVTLLISWVPALLVYTEIWKWWLIGTGMTYGARIQVVSGPCDCRIFDCDNDPAVPLAARSGDADMTPVDLLKKDYAFEESACVA